MNKQQSYRGNRIPYEYFITSGKGESDAGSSGLPYETGSYDAALTDAGINNVNVIKYSSMVPPQSKIISKQKALKNINWGEVMECIQAESSGPKGSKLSAAVITTDIIDPNGKYLGGIACEYSGNQSKKELEQSLCVSIKEIVERRNFGRINKSIKIGKSYITDKGFTIIPGKHFIYDTMIVKKSHGTVIASLCFVSYIYPALKK
jgi:pyruvoyl-dependent arginine decarboxylase